MNGGQVLGGCTHNINFLSVEHLGHHSLIAFNGKVACACGCQDIVPYE